MKNNDSLETASSHVSSGSLRAKDILKKAFACTDSLTNDEVLRQIGNVFAAGVTRLGSCTGSAWLISSKAGEFLEAFWSDLQSLNEGDREAVIVRIQVRLEQSEKVRGGGRPKGAKAQDFEQQIRLAAALQFLGCSRAGMVPFLYPAQHCEEAGKWAIDKLLSRDAVLIEQEYIEMNEALALKIVKAHVTVELAERIVRLDL